MWLSSKRQRGYVACVGEQRKECWDLVLVGNLRKRLLGKTYIHNGWKYNIKVGIESKIRGCLSVSSKSVSKKVAGFCQHGNELRAS